VTATVTTVDEATGIVSLDRALHFTRTRSGIIAGRSTPERIANAYKFSRWHLTGVAVGAVLPGSTRALWLLYTPTDEAVGSHRAS
jgi:hypothetical protein